MSNELKPCPFCGGEISERISNFGVSLMFFECHDCGATVSFNEDVCNYAASVGDYMPSIMAFNKRTERTCKRVIKSNERPGKKVFNQWYACSECGKPMNQGDSYCPSCGARVEGD